MKTATTLKELPTILGGAPVGTTIRIDGYVDSAGVTKNLVVRTLGPDGYVEMKKASLEILEKTPAPELPGFPPVVAAQARDALMASYRSDPKASEKVFKDPYTEAPEGGYSTKEGEPAIYLLRTEDCSPNNREISDTRVDLVRAKAALVRSLNLPAGRYLHTIKLSEGKFKSVQLV
jgi:hypothetical protein